MPIESISLNVKDSVKIMDYADPRTYNFTAFIANPTDAEVADALAMMKTHGDAFLKGTEVKVAVRTRAAKETPNEGAKEAPPVSAPTPDASSGGGPAPAPASSPVAEAPPPAASGIDDLIGKPAGPAKEITDQDVVNAVMKANERLKGDAVPIRELVESYNPQKGLRVFKAQEIEQKDRAGFIEKLNALQ